MDIAPADFEINDALAPHISVDAMRNPDICWSDRFDKLVDAVTTAQRTIKNPVKNKTATVTTKQGRTYQFSWADLASVLDAVRVPLAENHIMITQAVVGRHLQVQVSHNSGQWVRSSVRLEPADNGPQAFASELTAYRRHLIQGLLSIASDDDDDGNIAAGNSVTPGKRDRTRWDDDVPGPASPPDDPLIESATRTFNASEGVALLRLWHFHRARIEALRNKAAKPGEDASQCPFTLAVDTVSQALNRSMGTVIAAAWRGAMLATTKEHEAALQQRWNNEWSETLDRFKEAEPAAFGDLVKHMNYRAECIAAAARKAEEAARTAKPAAPEFAYYVADAQGDIGTALFNDPVQWAKAYEHTYHATPVDQLEALQEHNLEALTMADQNTGAMLILNDLVSPEMTPHQPAAASPPPPAPPPPALTLADAVVQIPRGRGDGFDLMSYLKQIEASLADQVRTAADMAVWETANGPLYGGPDIGNTTKLRILKAVAGKKRELGIPAPGAA